MKDGSRSASGSAFGRGLRYDNTMGATAVLAAGVAAQDAQSVSHLIPLIAEYLKPTHPQVGSLGSAVPQEGVAVCGGTDAGSLACGCAGVILHQPDGLSGKRLKDFKRTRSCRDLAGLAQHRCTAGMHDRSIS